MSKPSFVYVTYIATTPEKLWQALTDPATTEKYWFGFRIDARGKVGDHMVAHAPSGKEVHNDPILVSDPPKKLVYEWNPQLEDQKGERPSRVTFDLEPLKEQVKLTVTHEEFDVGSRVFPKISMGWPAVLSSLKSWLETGKALQSNWAVKEPAA